MLRCREATGLHATIVGAAVNGLAAADNGASFRDGNEIGFDHFSFLISDSSIRNGLIGLKETR
jgi:hypothetical protein